MTASHLNYLSLLFAWLYHSALNSQTNYLFVGETTQRTNFFLFKNTSDQLFISSTDGLNIFNGISIKEFHPGSNNMYGSNIQSTFFEDTTGQIWFTTYEALHVFHPEKDDFEYFFMTDSHGDTIKENYVAFKLDDQLLYLKAGNRLFTYDISNQKVYQRYEIDLTGKHQFEVIAKGDERIMIAAGQNGLNIYQLLKAEGYRLLASEDLSLASLSVDEKDLWLGSTNGKLYQFDLGAYKLMDSFAIATSSVLGICKYSRETLLLSYFRNSLTVFNTKNRRIDSIIYPERADGCGSFGATLRPYIDHHFTLWMGSVGQGVYFQNLRKNKFNHILDGMDITKILPMDHQQYLVLTRRNGILIMDSAGNILRRWQSLPDQEGQFSVRTGIWVEKDKLLFTTSFKLYELDLSLGRISKKDASGHEGPIYFEQIDQLSNGKIVASMDTTFLYEVSPLGQQISFRPYFEPIANVSKMLYFKQDAAANLFISNDEKEILIFRPNETNHTHDFVKVLPIQGGVISITDRPDYKTIYLTNARGLYKIDKQTFVYEKIVDEKQYLNQTIYSSQPDEKGNLWLGTNKGLIKFNPETRETKAFSLMDGIQALEYNSHVSYKTNDGHMFFGGVNGLNYFHPDSVKLSQEEAPVYISNVMINDEPDSTFKVPQYIREYELPYFRNTITFHFHAIDYADPQATRVRYQLLGMDNKYLESGEAAAYARYANLPPGHYTFSIIGSNSDGVWNKEPREISIIIRPPFWRTWWFITLSIAVVAFLAYWTIRTYYQRKLEKKNQLLREQALIIEKQTAVEHERTRIASEMHDDLGSGLTTIRYLSDKALKQAKDTEEAEQIKKIADHSNSLVRNMSEIIWAMNSRYDNAESLTGYLRRYASEFLEEHKLPLKFSVMGDQLAEMSIGGEKRRNLFLVFKEILHNTVKYSSAQQVEINVDVQDELKIRISEIGGKGFNPSDSIDKGNGLYNCNKRMASIHGSIKFDR
ncbi:MAG: triple tyrosine motif-containing protein, partial [Nitrososphaerales archaeon]